MGSKKGRTQSFSLWVTVLGITCLNVQTPAHAAKPKNAVSSPTKSSQLSVSISASQWTPKFVPLFRAPVLPTRASFSDAVGFDSDTLNTSAQAAATRAVQIRQVEAEYKTQPAKSQQALNVGLKLVKLLEEQCMYLEYLRAAGENDPKYPDVGHFVRSTRSQLINTIEGLLKSFPKNDRNTELRSLQIVSRLKIGDPTVRNEALKFVGSKRSTDQQKVALVGLVLDFDAKKQSSPFGNLEFAASAASDATSRGAIRYFSAELAMSRKSYDRAIASYQDALKDLGRLKRNDGKPGPLTGHLLLRLRQAALLRNNMNVDAEVISAMQSVGSVESARFYAETIALNNLAKQPGRAAKIYADIQESGDSASSTTSSIELRILDIFLGAKDLATAQTQWQRVFKAGDALKPQLIDRILYTQNLALSKANTKLDSDNVSRFVSLHDFFSENSGDYASREEWSLKVIELLWRIKRVEEVVKRSDNLAGQTKKTNVLLSALRFSLRARETMLGLSAEPRFVRSKKLSGDEQTAQAYVVTLDKMKSAVSGPELEQSVFQAAYVTQLMGQEEPARQRFEDALTKYPRSRLSGESVSYLIDSAESKKDWSYVEKIARLALSARIAPSKESHKNLRVVIEKAVYSNAQQLASQGQFEPAAEKFIAFQKEFPRHQNAATALDLAAKNYLQAKKTDAAVTQMEALLKSYSSTGYVKETMWQAAELSRGIAQFLRAAKHYEDFAKKYPKDGVKRSAWLKSAEMHKSLGRFANAVAHYENYLAQLTSNSDKLKIAREIADTHFQFGRPTEAVAAYERMMKFVSNPDDEIYLQSQILRVQLRQGVDSLARKTAARVLNIKPSSADGFRLQAKAKYSIAYLDAPALRTRNVQNRKDLAVAIKSIVADYDKLKSQFLAPCEVPGLEYCSAGYYEAARLSEEIAKIILAVELPPTLNPADVNEIRTLISQNSERLQQESKTYAVQAEQALSNGAPDAETAERIRTYAQQVRGESSDTAPLE